MTSSSGQPMDIYENPSEHYGPLTVSVDHQAPPPPQSLLATPPATADRSVQSTLEKTNCLGGRTNNYFQSPRFNASSSSYGGSVEGIADGANSVSAVFAGSSSGNSNCGNNASGSDYGCSGGEGTDDIGTSQQQQQQQQHSRSSSTFGKPLPQPQLAAVAGGESPYSSDSSVAAYSPRLPPRSR